MGLAKLVHSLSLMFDKLNFKKINSNVKNLIFIKSRTETNKFLFAYLPTCLFVFCLLFACFSLVSAEAGMKNLQLILTIVSIPSDSHGFNPWPVG